MVLVGGEHYVGRVEGEVVELGVAWDLLERKHSNAVLGLLLLQFFSRICFCFLSEVLYQRTVLDCRRQSLDYEC